MTDYYFIIYPADYPVNAQFDRALVRVHELCFSRGKVGDSIALSSSVFSKRLPRLPAYRHLNAIRTYSSTHWLRTWWPAT